MHTLVYSSKKKQISGGGDDDNTNKTKPWPLSSEVGVVIISCNTSWICNRFPALALGDVLVVCFALVSLASAGSEGFWEGVCVSGVWEALLLLAFRDLVLGLSKVICWTTWSAVNFCGVVWGVFFWDTAMSTPSERLFCSPWTTGVAVFTWADRFSAWASSMGLAVEDLLFLWANFGVTGLWFSLETFLVSCLSTEGLERGVLERLADFHTGLVAKSCLTML